MKSECGLPPPQSSEEGSHLDSGTPLEVPGAYGDLPDGLRKPSGPRSPAATPALDLGTPLGPAPTHMKPAVRRRDSQGVPVKPVLRHSPPHAAVVGGIRLLGSREAAILSHLPAIDVGPAGDARLLFNMGTREGFNSSDDGLSWDLWG